MVDVVQQTESDQYVTSITDTESTTTFDREQINLELLQLVWLTSGTSSNDNVPDIARLRLIIVYTKIYDDPESCLRHIDDTKATITFFVCSIRQYKTVLHIAEKENIEKMYFYCNENEESLNDKPLSQESKVSTN